MDPKKEKKPSMQHVGQGIMLEVEQGRHPSNKFGKNSVINILGAFCTIMENSIILLPPDTPKGSKEGKTPHNGAPGGSIKNLLHEGKLSY